MNGQKIIIFFMCFNVMLYLFGFQLVDGDLMDKLFDKSTLDLNNDNTQINFNNNVKTQFPQQAENSGSNTIQTFIDGLSLIWSLALLIFNLLTSPIAIFSFLHPVIAIMLGIPLCFMYLLAIISFIRGAGEW